MSETDQVELESQEFREALLEALNGQSVGLHRLIKLTDDRFRRHAARISKMEITVAKIDGTVDETFQNVSTMLPLVDDIRFVRRLAILVVGAVGLAATVLSILTALGVV